MGADVQISYCTFNSCASLYLAYMPFIKNGGLFVRTIQTYSLAEKMNLSIHLMDEKQPCLIEGKIVWITPKGSQGNKSAGIGVQFCGGNARDLRNKIETYLAGMLTSTQVTDTV